MRRFYPSVDVLSSKMMNAVEPEISIGQRFASIPAWGG
jgi:hypothetical protein